METSALRRQPVVIVFSILAGLQVLSAGLALTDVLGKDTMGLLILVIAAVQAAATFYVRGMVAPWDTVVSQLTSDGRVISGPAADGIPGPPPNPPTGPTGPVR